MTLNTIYEDKAFNAKELIQSIKDELKCDESGNAFASIRGTARLVDVDHGGLSRTFRSGVDKTANKTNKMFQMLTIQGFQPVDFSHTGIPDNALIVIIKYYAHFAGKRCTSQAKALDVVLSPNTLKILIQEAVSWENKEPTYKKLCLLENHEYIPKKRFNTVKSIKNKERFYQEKLSKSLNARLEVYTDLGRIDILSDDEIIEVKNINSWKSALGQVLAYSDYFPNHLKRIHLFGKIDKNHLPKIIEICSKYDVSVTWEGK